MCILADISERKANEEKIRHQAHHDALTGLPNRMLFRDRLEQAVVRAARNGEQFALMFLDLDHFKEINDNLGHHVGDLLLKMVSQRLLEAVRASDTVCRLGGDEFMLLMPMTSAAEAKRVAGKIVQSLFAPYQFDDGNSELNISVSLGISLYPEHGATAERLIHCADIAMYRAKRSGRNAYQLFDADAMDDGVA